LLEQGFGGFEVQNVVATVSVKMALEEGEHYSWKSSLCMGERLFETVV